jgi:hypothetical protein
MQNQAQMLDRFAREMEQPDPSAHIVLKGHLMIEEWLTRNIAQHMFHPEHMLDGARLSFAQKLALCRTFALRKDKLGMWELIAAVNSLRNELAHALDSAKRRKKTDTLLAIYFRETAGSNLAVPKEALQEHVLRGACALSLGFLASFSEDAQGLRALIHAFDREKKRQRACIRPSR